MPEWTNQWGIPLPLALALQRDDYAVMQNSLRDKLNAPMFSVTNLIGPPQLAVLKRRHMDKLVIDVVKRVHATAGKGIDQQMDLVKMPGQTYSHTRFVTGLHVEGVGPVYISFEPDLVYERRFEEDQPGFRLVDLKDTKVRAIAEGIKWEWSWQLRIYRYLLQQGNTYMALYDRSADQYTLHPFTPINVTRTSLCARLKDWSKWEAYTKGGVHRGYPKAEVVVLEQPVAGDRKEIEDREVRNYLRERLVLHTKADTLPDDALPECSDSDRWAKPSVWAIIQTSGKTKGRALPKCSSFATKAQAEAVLKEKLPKAKTGLGLEYRPGVQTRCEDWCEAAQVCHQYKRILQSAKPF